MSNPVPPRPDAPTVWPRRMWPVVLAMVAFVTLNVLLIRGIGRVGERFLYTDAAGVLTVSLIVIDGYFLVFFAIAGGSRARRWQWRRFHP
jgi:hypothetical protein